MHPRPDRRWRSPSAPRSTRTLHHQIALASFALDRALDRGRDGRSEEVREAREALEAFDLLERATTDVVVPREVRRRVRQAADALAADRLELARADLGRAGGELERWWLRQGGRA